MKQKFCEIAQLCIDVFLIKTKYIRALKQLLSLLDIQPNEIFCFSSIGNFQDALSCYESLGKTMKDSLELKSGLLKCYLEMDQPHSASTLAKGLVAKDPDNEQVIPPRIILILNLTLKLKTEKLQ